MVQFSLNLLKSDMKLLSKALLCLSLATGSVGAQETSMAGFVFANAVAIKGNVSLTANGKRLTSKGGIAPGIASSGLGLPVGKYQIEVTGPGCEPAKASIDVAVGTTPIVVAYLQRVTDPRSNVTKNYIRLLQLPAAFQNEKYLISALSVDPTASLTATAGGRSSPLEFSKPVNFESKAIKIADATGASEDKSGDERMSYYCFAYHDADGKPASILVPQRIYQW